MPWLYQPEFRLFDSAYGKCCLSDPINDTAKLIDHQTTYWIQADTSFDIPTVIGGVQMDRVHGHNALYDIAYSKRLNDSAPGSFLAENQIPIPKRMLT
jgi:hypothetical protein